MASKRAAVPAKHLFNGFRASQQPTRQCISRSMATEAPLPSATIQKAYSDANLESAPTQTILEDRVSIPPAPVSTIPTHTLEERPTNPFLKTATCTLYQFPSLQPTGFTTYPSTHLLLPLRKDILHRAVIFEADNSRSGTASTKWRSEVHGSNRKVRPQKGTGHARLGDKKSPSIRGGGVAHGPHPRDFSTDLPLKVYDLAWRTALSYRWKMGELCVIDGEAEIEGVHHDSAARYMRDLLKWNRMGKTLFVTQERRTGLYGALEEQGMGKYSRAIESYFVDVKDLLESPKVYIEREALRQILMEHESDLAPRDSLAVWEASRAATGEDEQGVLSYA